MSIDSWGLTDAIELLEQAPCGLVVTTEDGTILRANRTFAGWIGCSPSDLRGRRFQELLTMGGRIFHQTHWAPLMKLQGSVAEVKLDLLHAQGHVITMLLNGVRREHPEGVRNELAFFGTIERDRYERELLAARKRAEELLSEKSMAESALKSAQAELAVAYERAERRASFAEQMIAIASHDLKNPLTAIKMASELLGRGERREREQKLLSNIVSSSERAQRMIADLLDLASVRIGQGMGIKRQLVDVSLLVDQSVGELRVAFVHAKIRHLSKCRGFADVDPDRTQQMIGNLVANSVAYGDLKHPITITTELRCEALWITVHNHGQVIPESLIPDLFEPMTRASDRTENVRSVGLGLFIVREIANAHGGTITVHSAPVTGTAVEIQMPLTGIGS
ncbi:PAS domain-containing protein [Pseudomonas sp. SbB1]|uniref:histidine kinase n=1 Tax=Pseudomonas putida (strain GB-1) TaxID=76869 RepID=B0KFG2_PSEPG|nr:MULTISPECIES: PAS domain-containing sensor histidine kinase [Pseudomonas]ABY98885.1 PAS/PAC sensor signal transduction histidine kinase [Pseudomonas putida GB-1]MBP0708907.1 PAS domain-containing protein [Pseudomonas sp. T34]MCK2188344.1 PAS domain-containing sensor histidine kinase [Pseudomonas sp. MB04B]MDD2083959.1 PAS domain-containing sensor histidine kinase [Pseudomonas putida]MDD2093139.1 PAS domain-containing sensor histidine kinase [Pseudomonas putida]